MIYRIEVENFRSARDTQVLDLTIAPNVPDPHNRFASLALGSKLRVPKAIVIFGANASGKTTLLRVLHFLFQFTGQSNADVSPETMGLGPFADGSMLNRPIKLAVELTGMVRLSADERGDIDIHSAAGLFRYEVEFRWHGDAASGQFDVAWEALRYKPTEAGRWHRIFERDEKGGVKGARGGPIPFPVSGFAHIIKTLPRNASLIPTFARFEHAQAQAFLLTIAAVRSNLGLRDNPSRDDALIKFLAQYPDTLASLNEELRRIDVGIEEMSVATLSGGVVALFRHAGLENAMGWYSESQGTRSFISIYPLLEMAFQTGSVAIVDELDDQIHPLILPEILDWFYDSSDRNPHDTQLWASCHAASILDDLVKEQVVLCEKAPDGATEFFSLMDVQRVRRGDNLYKKYLSGIYGGVPQIG